jgi:hypothetical protein
VKHLSTKIRFYNQARGKCCDPDCDCKKELKEHLDICAGHDTLDQAITCEEALKEVIAGKRVSEELIHPIAQQLAHVHYQSIELSEWRITKMTFIEEEVPREEV